MNSAQVKELTQVNRRRIPAEFEIHDSTWLGFPFNPNDWPGKFRAAEWAFVDYCRRLSYFERINLICTNEKSLLTARNMLERAKADLENIIFHICPMNRNWMRDTMPAFIYSNEHPEIISMNFNGWAKYSNYESDKLIPRFVAGKIDIALIKAYYNNTEFILEGGAIDVNGAGTLLTSRECLLHESIQVRNPNMTQQDYEKWFLENFGIEKVIWLNKGIAGDDTHGHIDDLCRFVSPNTIVTAFETSSTDENYNNLNENYEILLGSKLANGEKPEIIKLPMPEALYFEGLRLPASYANFYIANSVCFVPTFNDKNDRIALGILAELMPQRTVIGINSVDLVWGFGTLHCLSHEQPLLR